MIGAILATLSVTAAMPLPTPFERAVIEQVYYDSVVPDERRDPWLLLELLRLEEHPDIAVPDRWRGMALAASYRESRWKADKAGDGGHSIGLCQLQKWHWKSCGKPDRTDPVGNVRCWLWRVRRTHDDKVRRACDSSNAWPAAWQWVARPLPGGGFPGCDNHPRTHIRVHRRWRRGWRMRQLHGGR